MTRRLWRLYAARAALSFRHLFALPSLNKSNPDITKHLTIFSRFYPQILPYLLKKKSI